MPAPVPLCRRAVGHRPGVDGMAGTETPCGQPPPPRFQGRNRIGPVRPGRCLALAAHRRKPSGDNGGRILARLSQQAVESQDLRFSHGRAPHHASPSSTHDGTTPRPASGACRAVGIATAVAPAIACAAVAAPGDIVVLHGVQPRPADRGLPQPDTAIAALPWIVGGHGPPTGRPVHAPQRCGVVRIRSGRRETMKTKLCAFAAMAALCSGAAAGSFSHLDRSDDAEIHSHTALSNDIYVKGFGLSLGVLGAGGAGRRGTRPAARGGRRRQDTAGGPPADRSAGGIGQCGRLRWRPGIGMLEAGLVIGAAALSGKRHEKGPTNRRPR
ncbi:hypothetical protein OJJOAM_003637 [Cupriavidus sp. H18C1]